MQRASGCRLYAVRPVDAKCFEVFLRPLTSHALTLWPKEALDQADKWDVTRGEVLAMRLASKAGINVAAARVEVIDETAVAAIRRFDRTEEGGRISYVSATTMLQSDGREAVHAYTELVDVLLRDGLISMLV